MAVFLQRAVLARSAVAHTMAFATWASHATKEGEKL
jgi:hypothetical protein